MAFAIAETVYIKGTIEKLGTQIAINYADALGVEVKSTQ